MKVTVSKSIIDGSVRAPSSKSYTIRALMCAAMASGRSKIEFALDSDDTVAAINVLRAVGIQIEREGDTLVVDGGVLNQANYDLYCNDSATTLRFMTAIASIVPGTTRLVSGPSLAKRPIESLIRALKQIGVDCYLSEDESVVVVDGIGLEGGLVKLEGNVSSQYLSALLIIGACARKGIRIHISTPLQSKPYVLMTIDCLKEFGINIEYTEDLREFTVARQLFKPTEYVVEGDWSSASYLLALGAVSGRTEVINLKNDSLQGDKILLYFMREMGAVIEENRESIIVTSSPLGAIKANLEDCIDLLPTLSVLAASASGTSEFVGINRGRIKESNRVSAIVDGLNRLGLVVVEGKDRLMITGGNLQSSTTVDSWNDHRIAMAFAILGMKTGGITINNAECVSKTFPEFWRVINKLGGKVTGSGE